MIRYADLESVLQIAAESSELARLARSLVHLARLLSDFRRIAL